MILIVKYFGAVADITQTKEEQFYIADELNSISNIQLKLENQYPGIKNIPYTFAINQAITTGNEVITENDELALLPPFAGG